VDLSERVAGEVRRHPWEVARARSYRRLLAAHTDLRTVRTVLDIGAGDGWFASDAQADVSGASIVCWDVNYRSADLSTPAGDRITRTTVRPDGRFDVVLALDVLEHIDDDDAFLAGEIVPAVAPGGRALLGVPAHPCLFSAHDRMLQHVRRYRPADFRALVARHLDVVASGSMFASLVPVRAVAVAGERLGRERAQTGVGAWTAGPAVTRAVTLGLAADAAVGRGLARVGVPWPGLSTWIVARRRT
jgi:SAM-dependent methyltransferase